MSNTQKYIEVKDDVRGHLSATKSLEDKDKEQPYKAGDQFLVHGDKVSVTDEYGLDWELYRVTRIEAAADPKFYISEDDVKEIASTDVISKLPPIEDVVLENFGQAVLDNSFLTGSNPGVLLAIAHLECALAGKPWEKAGDSFKAGKIVGFRHPEHGGVGPFQLREIAWDRVNKAFPARFDPRDRRNAAMQARAIAMLEQKFFESRGTRYTTLELYYYLIFGEAAAKAIADAEAQADTKSVEDILKIVYPNDADAVSNELKWRGAYLKSGDNASTLAQMKAALVPLINAGLAAAEALIVEMGVRDGKAVFPTTPKDTGDVALQSYKRTGDFVSTGHPKTRVPREQVIMAKSPPSKGYRSPRGLLVEILQKGLAAGNMYHGDIDGDFGPKSETAVRNFQQRYNSSPRNEGRPKLTVDGKVRARDWEIITGLDAPSIFDRCLQLTASWEGTGFKGVVGNFDEAIMTWGIIGFTAKHDLPALIRAIDEYEGLLEECFSKGNAAKLREMMAEGVSESALTSWVSQITKPGQKRYLKDEWTEGFAALGDRAQVQRLQMNRAETKYWQGQYRSMESAIKYHAENELDIGLLFDASVQNGGIGKQERIDAFKKWTTPSASTKQRREGWAEAITKAGNPRWYRDVWNRKAAFISGDTRANWSFLTFNSGKIHGKHYRLEDWGLSADHKVTREQLEVLKQEVDVSYMPDSFGLMAELADEYLKIAGDMPWLRSAMRLENTQEKPGSGNNQTIINWAIAIGGAVKRTFVNEGDAVPWCGLFVAHCMQSNGIPAEPQPLWAQNWQNFGNHLAEPAYGCVIVFRRKWWGKNKKGQRVEMEGGHVGFYISEDDTSYHVLGGNQRDSVNVTKVKKSQVIAYRWPKGYESQMKPGRRFNRNFKGKYASSSELA